MNIEVEPGVRLFVEDINPGGSRTALFLHGWPLNHGMFEYQYNALPAHGIRCVAVDMRGYGNSAKPWGGYHYDRMADDIRIIVDAMNLENISLIGHFMGGAVAIRYMARHGGYRVARLALLSAAAPAFTQRTGYPWGMTRQHVDELIQGISHNRPQALADFAGLVFARTPPPSFLGWFRDMALAAGGHSTIKGLEALRDEDLSQDLPGISVPTGIFHGVLDKVCPYQFAIEMNKAIPGSVIHRFDNSGHAVYFDELDRFNQTLLKFLGR